MQGHSLSNLPEQLSSQRVTLESTYNFAEELSTDQHVQGMAEVVAGYMDCMEEAIRYLKEVERYPDNHPALLGLTHHLALYREQMLSEAVHPSPPLTAPTPPLTDSALSDSESSDCESDFDESDISDCENYDD